MQTKIFTLLLATALFIGCSPSKQALIVEVNNPASIDKENEMVELDWITVQQKLSLSAEETIIVTGDNGQQLPYQLVTNDKTGIKETLIFPVSLQAGQTATFQITTGEPETFTPLVYGRLVPERKDDFAWENNRVAFRIYGPALKATGEISNGMDFWAKKTESLVIDKWYKDDLAGVASYHEDHGEGLDFYKVGRTLGLGMTAPLDNDTLCLGDNFVTAEILDNGPLRITLILTYDPYEAGGETIDEVRFISLDAYRHFNKVTNVFNKVDADELTVATGIVMEKDKPEIIFGDNSGIIAYETPADNVNGTIYTAVIHPDGFRDIKVANGHLLGLNNYQPGTSYTYYAGGGWSKAGFDSFEAWTQFVKQEKEKIDQPFTIQIK
ncbi:MAG: DUF4861 domain-containing protein [Proteiniphilum sp.]|jgi:hypothetical protein|uniref:DUF4861 domain-containing protein n=1 Tax=Proteiniphilum sp. TaxID=1926877 RepID=UPI002B1FB8BB|nr:DUF4861 domain-containing protein [Proteiniphilum sp.]MEA5128467.1 DUF4861 domain-containing protein [Proteiniphilum sp.]